MNKSVTQENLLRGKQIRMLREQMGLTQYELSVKVGVSPNSISSWEKGESKPSIRHWHTLCHIFHITTAAVSKTAEVSEQFRPEAFQVAYLNGLGLCPECQQKVEGSIRRWYNAGEIATTK